MHRAPTDKQTGALGSPVSNIEYQYAEYAGIQIGGEESRGGLDVYAAVQAGHTSREPATQCPMSAKAKPFM